MNVCSNGPSHMTKMATMPMCGKNPSGIFYSETSRPMTFVPGIPHQLLGPYTVCSKCWQGIQRELGIISSVLMQPFKFYDRLIDQVHTRMAHFSDVMTST